MYMCICAFAVAIWNYYYKLRIIWLFLAPWVCVNIVDEQYVFGTGEGGRCMELIDLYELF